MFSWYTIPCRRWLGTKLPAGDGEDPEEPEEEEAEAETETAVREDGPEAVAWRVKLEMEEGENPGINKSPILGQSPTCIFGQAYFSVYSTAKKKRTE